MTILKREENKRGDKEDGRKKMRNRVNKSRISKRRRGNVERWRKRKENEDKKKNFYVVYLTMLSAIQLI
jgi:hypothetical protein